MKSLENPYIYTMPFAQNGDKSIIPAAATGTFNASLAEGFPPITATPLNQGGLPPSRWDFNGILYALSSVQCFMQNGGMFTFNADVSAAIGGYPLGAVLAYVNNSGQLMFLRSAKEDNTSNFVENSSVIGTDWIPVFEPAGFLPLTGGTMTGEIVSRAANNYRVVHNQYGAFWRNDGGNFYLMQTAKGDAYGTYNEYRPLTLNFNTGTILVNPGLDENAGGGQAVNALWANRKLAKKANINSPAFTGSPTAPYPASGDNSTRIPNTQWVNDAIYKLMPIASVIMFAGADGDWIEQRGWMLCDGSSLSRSTYADLFSVIGTTYGANDSSTFRIPDFRGRVPQGANETYPVGTRIEAGLPNITGHFAGNSDVTPDGAIAQVTGEKWLARGNQSDDYETSIGLYLNAQNSSSVYGNSTTVQPPAQAINFYIKFR